MSSRSERGLKPAMLTPRQRAVQVSMGGHRNVYVYGPPGTGKTTVLNAAHASRTRSTRWHCAEFFRAVHDGLPVHGRDLDTTVKSLTGRSEAVFFDEFHLHDVADAIYLHRALRWWDSHEVRVVVTSNYQPEGLLPNPLLHHAAEPVIAQIREHFEVIDLDEGVDFRRANGAAKGGFSAGGWLPVVRHAPATASLSLNSRMLSVLPTFRRPETIETTFFELCGRPWSTTDYLELLAGHDSLVIHDAPHPSEFDREPGQRLANLIDVAYDRDIPVTIHSPGQPEDLRTSEFPPLDVDRTISRLHSLITTRAE